MGDNVSGRTVPSDFFCSGTMLLPLLGHLLIIFHNTVDKQNIGSEDQGGDCLRLSLSYVLRQLI